MAAMSATAATQEVLRRCQSWSPDRYAAAQRALAELLSSEARFGTPTRVRSNGSTGLASGAGLFVFGILWLVLIFGFHVVLESFLLAMLGIASLLAGGAMLWRGIQLLVIASSLKKEAATQPLLSQMAEADAVTQEVWSMYAGLRWPNLEVLAVRLGGVRLMLQSPGLPVSPIFAAFNAVVIWPRGLDIEDVSLPGLTTAAPPSPEEIAPGPAADWQVYEPGAVGPGADDFGPVMAPPPPAPAIAPPAPPPVSSPATRSLPIPPPPQQGY